METSYMPKALVSGATGFIGKRLIAELIKQGVIVTAMSRNIPRKKIKNCIYLAVDITKVETFNKLPKDFDVIFHTAAYIPEVLDTNISDKKILETNAWGTLNLITFATENNIECFIHSSSISVHGLITSGVIDEESPITPHSMYGLSKKIAEDIIVYYSHIAPMRSVILRYSSIYGPDMTPTTVLPLFMKRALHNEDITILGAGNRSQDFVFVDDVISANILAWKNNATGIFLIGSGRETSIIKLAKTILSQIPKSSSKLLFKESIDTNETQRLHCNISKAQKTFGYSPKYSLREGIRRMIT
jgi:UDP-glucose 4-epimerase